MKNGMQSERVQSETLSVTKVEADVEHLVERIVAWNGIYTFYF